MGHLCKKILLYNYKYNKMGVFIWANGQFTSRKMVMVV